LRWFGLPACTAVACQEHGTTFRGFLPRARWQATTANPEGQTSITGTAQFVPATLYIASLPFQDKPPNGGYRIASGGLTVTACSGMPCPG
jgi:hypothetical protein